MIGLGHYLTLSAILFVLSIAGIIINRRNLILLLMCIELMLLAVNFNFIAFSRHLGDETGQVFVFFILTVAAAEAAIGRSDRCVRLQKHAAMVAGYSQRGQPAFRLGLPRQARQVPVVLRRAVLRRDHADQERGGEGQW